MTELADRLAKLTPAAAQAAGAAARATSPGRTPAAPGAAIPRRGAPQAPLSLCAASGSVVPGPAWSRGAPSTTSPWRWRLRGRAGRGGAGARAGRDRPAARGAAHGLRARWTARRCRWSRRSAGSRCRWRTCRGWPRRIARRRSGGAPREEATRPFDLAGGPLLRAACCCGWGPQDHVLVVVPASHRRPRAGRWGCCWARPRSSARRPTRRAAPRRCRSWRCSTPTTSVWQRQWLQGEVLERQLAYWRQQLAGAPPGPQLPPTIRARPSSLQPPSRRAACRCGWGCS